MVSSADRDLIVPKTAGLVVCTLTVLIQGAACSKPESGASPSAASASAPASVTAAAPASASAKPAPARTAGEWTGTYDARHYLIEMSKKEGAVKEWQADKGEAHSGKGELSLRIAEDGSVSGSSQGPLGELVITGEFDGERLRLRLAPLNPEKQPAFTGHLVAERKGDVFKGRLQASSGDSLTVRDAPAELRAKGAASPK